MKRMNSRAQFFLLAAVIISAIVISLGITANTARISSSPKNFYDFTYEVKRESGAVIDYEIYSDIQFNGEDAKLEDFVDLLAMDIRERDASSNFLFIYGDNSSTTVKNYGSRATNVGGELVEGKAFTVVSKVYAEGFYSKQKEDLDKYEDYAGVRVFNETDLKNVEEISVEIDGNSFPFKVSKYRQVVFIIQKDVKDESFVAVK